MNTLSYYKYLLIGKILRKGNEYMVSKMRAEGMYIGENTHIYSNIGASEPYLIKIGSNCTISTEVSFITHDASIGLFVEGGRNEASDICGPITIGNNVFIGNKSIILYGVTIPNKTIVAAGSIVTKSIKEEGCIIGGNPARIIGRVDEYLQKSRPYFLCLHGLNESVRMQKVLNSKLIKR